MICERKGLDYEPKVVDNEWWKYEVGSIQFFGHISFYKKSVVNFTSNLYQKMSSAEFECDSKE